MRVYEEAFQVFFNELQDIKKWEESCQKCERLIINADVTVTQQNGVILGQIQEFFSVVMVHAAPLCPLIS